MIKQKTTKIPPAHKYIGFLAILTIILIWISQNLISKLLVTFLAIFILILNSMNRK